MDDQTNPATEVEPEGSTGTAAEGSQVEIDPQDGNPEEGDEGLPASDLEEIEEEGEKFSAPKKFAEAHRKYKAGYMKDADYTQKTQVLADDRRKFDDDRKAYEADQKSYGELYALDMQIAEYSKINMPQLIQEAPEKALELQYQLQSLRDARSQRANDIYLRGQDRALKASQETARRIQEGNIALTRDIKGWSPEMEKTLRDYGKATFGIDIPANELAALPGHAKILHKAYMYDQLAKKQAQQAQKKPDALPVPQVRPSKSKNAPTEFRPGMSDADYDAWRNRSRKTSRA